MVTVDREARQGDLYLDRKDLPANLKPRNSRVLAYGEVTGHSHKVREETVQTFVDAQGNIWVQSEKPFHLDHDTHGSIMFDPGTYCLTRQREYDADAREQERRVAD